MSNEKTYKSSIRNLFKQRLLTDKNGSNLIQAVQDKSVDFRQSPSKRVGYEGQTVIKKNSKFDYSKLISYFKIDHSDSVEPAPVITATKPIIDPTKGLGNILEFANKFKRRQAFVNLNKIGELQEKNKFILTRMILNTINAINKRANAHLTVTEQLINELSKPTLDLLKDRFRNMNKEDNSYEEENAKKRDLAQICFLLKSMPGFLRFINYIGIEDQAIIGAASLITVVKFKKGHVVFHQNEKSDCFYGILEGKVEIVVTHSNKKYLKGKHVGLVSNEKLTQLSQGNCFGEWGLVDNTNRRATIVCLEDVILFKVDSNCFNLFFRKCITKAESDRRLFLRIRFNYFKNLAFNQFIFYFKSFVNLYLKSGDIVYDTSHTADSFYIVYQGECVCSVSETVDSHNKIACDLLKYSVGSIFGLESLDYIKKQKVKVTYNIEERNNKVTRLKSKASQSSLNILKAYSNKILTSKRSQSEITNAFEEDSECEKSEVDLRPVECNYKTKVVSTKDNTVLMKFSFQTFNQDPSTIKEWLSDFEQEKSTIIVNLLENIRKNQKKLKVTYESEVNHLKAKGMYSTFASNENTISSIIANLKHDRLISMQNKNTIESHSSVINSTRMKEIYSDKYFTIENAERPKKRKELKPRSEDFRVFTINQPQPTVTLTSNSFNTKFDRLNTMKNSVFMTEAPSTQYRAKNQKRFTIVRFDEHHQRKLMTLTGAQNSNLSGGS